METHNIAVADDFSTIVSPHSLGKLIEWKPESFLLVKYMIFADSPHSLGKLIEWKRTIRGPAQTLNTTNSPHSLGKLIEWKLDICEGCSCYHCSCLPTRWGN